MRSFASYVLAVLMLVMLAATGGAWVPSSDPGLDPVHLGPSMARLPFADDLPSVKLRSLPPGCRPPLADAVCAPPVLAGGLDVLRSPAELVPEEVTGVEVWRPLVAHFFVPTDVDRALRVIACESSGDPGAKNPRSTASGLFQHLASRWEQRAIDAGRTGADVFDPVANVAVAAWLVYEGGGWSHWAASRGCW